MLEDHGNLSPTSAKHERHSQRVMELNPEELVQILILLFTSYMPLGKPHQLYNRLFSYLLGVQQSTREFPLTASFCMPNRKTHSLTMRTENFMCLLITAYIQTHGPWKKKHAPFETPSQRSEQHYCTLKIFYN